MKKSTPPNTGIGLTKSTKTPRPTPAKSEKAPTDGAKPEGSSEAKPIVATSAPSTNPQTNSYKITEWPTGAVFNRPANPGNPQSEWMNVMMNGLGARYKEAFTGDQNAIADILKLALKAAEAVERLEARNHQMMAIGAEHFTEWPVRARTGEGAAKLLQDRLRALGVGEVRSDNRAPRSEWPDPALPVNKTAEEVRNIVINLWNENGETARLHGPLGKNNADAWFTAAWDVFLKRCDGDLGKDVKANCLRPHFNNVFKVPLPKNENAKDGASGKPSQLMPERKAMIAAGINERERQEREKQQNALEKSARGKATKRVRMEVLRAFKRWYVVEVVT